MHKAAAQTSRFVFVENALSRKNTKLNSIGRNLFLKYLKLLSFEVENKVSIELTEKFGIVIAGWSEGNSYDTASDKAFIGLFNKNFSNLIFMVGDNAPVNKCLADLLRVPFIGCASYRFNLACRQERFLMVNIQL
jgi:hypothetical protein